MRERKPIPKRSKKAVTAPKFNVATLQKIADDLEKGKYGKIPNGRLVVSDEMQPGLRANVFKGYWSYIVEYKLPGIATRPHLTLGEHPATSITEARQLAKTIRELGSMGIDVQEGLRQRLVAELKRDGTKWRPAMAPKP